MGKLISPQMGRLITLLPLLFLFHVSGTSQSVTSQNLEIDHIFVWCDDHIAISEVFKEKGFKSIIGNEHQGQGTIGSYVGFSNFYLEFMTISNKDEFETNAKASSLDGMLLKPNWKSNGSSPFGLAFRFIDSTNLRYDFDSFDYRQDWLRENTFLKVSTNNKTHPKEPMIFIVPDYLKHNPSRWGDRLVNSSEIESMSSVRVESRSSDWSDGIVALNKFNNLEIITSDQELITIHFDQNKTGQSIDFRPELPLVIK